MRLLVIDCANKTLGYTVFDLKTKALVSYDVVDVLPGKTQKESTNIERALALKSALCKIDRRHGPFNIVLVEEQPRKLPGGIIGKTGEVEQCIYIHYFDKMLFSIHPSYKMQLEIAGGVTMDELIEQIEADGGTRCIVKGGARGGRRAKTRSRVSGKHALNKKFSEINGKKLADALGWDINIAKSKLNNITDCILNMYAFLVQYVEKP